MTYLFSDGLDGQADLADRWAIRESEATLSAATGKFGGGSLLFTGIEGSGAALITPSFPVAAAARGSTTNPMHMSFYMKSAIVPFANRAIVVFRDGLSGGFMAIVGSSSGGISVGKFKNTVDESSLVTAPQGSVYDGNYHHVEVKVIADQVVGLVVVYIDNVKVIDFSGDTVSQGALSAEGFSAVSMDSATTATNIDDVLIWDEEGSDFVVSGQFGTHQIATIIPNGAGNSSQFTQFPASGLNFDKVDEAIADDDTTYVESGTIGNKDTYAYTNMPTGLDAVHGIAVHTRSKNDDIGIINAAIVARSGTSETDSATFTVSSAGIYANHTAFFNVDPDGGAAWTETRVNAAEFGYKVVA